LYNIKENKEAHLCLYYFKIIIMSLLTVLPVLIVVGVILWLVNVYIPLDREIKKCPEYSGGNCAGSSGYSIFLVL
jgi:hypothetical protein